MKKSKIIKIVISIGLSSILLMGCGSKNTNTKSSNADTQTQTTQQKEEKKVKLDKENAIVIEKEVDYKNIYELFKKQEIKAKEQYLNKTLKVTGEISKIEKEDGYIVIHLLSESHGNNINLYLEDTKENEEKTASLKTIKDSLDKGDVITAYGLFGEYAKRKGDTLYDIKLTNCELS